VLIKGDNLLLGAILKDAEFALRQILNRFSMAVGDRNVLDNPPGLHVQHSA
jgi:hypothetical protein